MARVLQVRAAFSERILWSPEKTLVVAYADVATPRLLIVFSAAAAQLP